MMKVLKLTLLFSLFFITTDLLAQPAFPTGGDGEACGGPFNPCPVPIDGGVGFLIAAGLAYGGKKLHDKKTSNSEL